MGVSVVERTGLTEAAEHREGVVASLQPLSVTRLRTTAHVRRKPVFFRSAAFLGDEVFGVFEHRTGVSLEYVESGCGQSHRREAGQKDADQGGQC